MFNPARLPDAPFSPLPLSPLPSLPAVPQADVGAPGLAQSLDHWETDVGGAPLLVPTSAAVLDAPASRPSGSAENPPIRAAMLQHRQGMTNGCGTTSLAMVLESFGIPADRANIDASIRPFGGAGLATTPDDIARYAREAGLQAQTYSDASVDDLVTQLRAGRAVTVLIDSVDAAGDRSAQGGAHYVNVVGVRAGSDGTRTIIYRDPNDPHYGAEMEMTEAQLVRAWSDVRLDGGGILAAVPVANRTYVAYDRTSARLLPPGSLVDHVRNAALDATMGGVNSLAAGVSLVGRGEVGAGLARLTGGALDTLAGGVGYVIGNLVGRNIEAGGDFLVDNGLRLLRGNAGQKIGGFFALVLGAILKALGFLLSLIGGLIASAGQLVSSPLRAAADSAEARGALRERLLHRPPGMQSTDEVLSRATLGQKRDMLHTLLPQTGVASAQDQQAALVVLRACTAAELQRLVGQRGAGAALLGHFAGPEAQALRALLTARGIDFAG